VRAQGEAVSARARAAQDAVARAGLAAATARIDGEWLLLVAPLRSRRAGAWTLLEANALLDAGCTFALGPGGLASVQAEARLAAGADPVELAERACAGIEAAFALLVRLEAGERVERAARAEAGTIALDLDLAALAAAAGWPFTARSAARLAVPLDLPGVFLQAGVEARAGGAVEAAVELARLEPGLPAASREAIAHLLLAASGVVRLARAVVEEETGDRQAVGFEVELDRRPGAAELDHALASLSVAARLCGREVRALMDETVAGLYLAARKGGARPAAAHPGALSRWKPAQEASHAIR
jgi:hypothetical protein